MSVDYVSYWIKLWFKSYPFTLSYEKTPWFAKYYFRIVENREFSFWPVKSLEHYQLYLRPDGIKSWYIIYFSSIVLLYLIFFIVDNNPFNKTNFFFGDIPCVLFIGTSMGVIYFLFYFFTFSVFSFRPVLSHCWTEDSDLFISWFRKVPQRIIIKNNDLAFFEKAFPNIYIRSSYFLSTYKYFPSKSRQPIYYRPNSPSEQKLVMMVSMLDFFQETSKSSGLLGDIKIILIWLSPSIVSLVVLFIPVLIDILQWESKPVHSKYVLIPSIIWFILTLIYLKWTANFLNKHRINELSDKNYIPPVIRSKLSNLPFRPDDYIYRNFEKKNIVTGVYLSFTIIFTVLLTFIIAIHNIDSSINNPPINTPYK